MIWHMTTSENITQPDRTRSLETNRRHALEVRDKNLQIVQDLERKLGVTERWKLGSMEWRAAAKRVAMRKYQCALDNLEQLVVARIFELTKMNMSQTGMKFHLYYYHFSDLHLGYSLRQHIAKALKARSQAVHNALDRYNAAAQDLTPPRPTLQWSDVVNYAFLSEFDLLRDAREDVRERLWSSPTGRMAMDLYFKIQRATEEIDRLNIEIQRLITYIQDEEKYLRAQELEYQVSQPAISHQITRYRLERSRYNAQHIRRLKELVALPGFTGKIGPGKHAGSDGLDVRVDDMDDSTRPSAEDVELEEEEDAEEEEISLARDFDNIMHIAWDT